MKLLLLFASLLVSATAVTLRTVYEFPNPTWLENVAVMRNGSLLVTVIGRPEVHIVNPTISPATASLVTSFPNANAVLGITEIAPNTFAVAVGSTTPQNTPVAGSFSLWSLDFGAGPRPNAAVKVTKITGLERMQLVNGIVALNPRTVLLADSFAGNIVRLDLFTKKYEVGLQDASLASNFSAPILPLGVNGLRVHKGYLYYSNSAQSLLGRVPVSMNGRAVGAFSVFAAGGSIMLPDDFAVVPNGDVYLTSPSADTLQYVRLDGRIETIAKGEPVSGGTVAILGKKNVLYVCTSGLEGGVPTRGGRVIEVSLSGGVGI
ncbi:hypothetical protein GQ44DRAFT_700514 [Phaeosphaeriaceae sp. PMI808]|nr:hypothetical protein GQ44DRAFT_700514 [Phaeosphaeriaceae sp. PMI808]